MNRGVTAGLTNRVAAPPTQRLLLLSMAGDWWQYLMNASVAAKDSAVVS